MSDGSSVSLQQGGSCGRAKVQLLQEARFQPPVCKRWCREVEERRKRRTEVFKENRDLREDLHKNHKSEILKREPSWFSESRTMNATFTGSDPGVQIQFNKPQVRMALTRKTKFQTAIQTSVQNVELTLGGNKLVQSLSLTEPSDPSCSESQLENRRWTQKRKTRVKESISEVRCRSANIRTRSKRTSKHVHTCCTACSKSCNEKCHLKTRSRSVLQTESRIRRRRKVHPSAFRGKGQLRLSIILQKRQLNIHIHEARGLMGKSQRSCDSYVKLTVTSDIGHRIRMKTGIVSNNKNPKYDQDFVLCVSDDLPGCQDVRLLVSVFRQPVDSRCTQLIGCMSFGIASLVSSSKCVIGWFYLLGEEFGQSKHLRVTSQQSKGVTRSEEAGPTDCSEFRISKLAADLGRTPDSAPESEPNLFTTSSVGLKDSTGHSLTYSQSHSFDPPDTDQHQRTRDHSSPQQLMVSIIRGKDGFGFTICSDCPVRVQAVDPGGPAHQSGLRQGDSVLQLNGLPVETWKCVDLAQTIRSSSHIVLVVWRRLPELQSGCEEWLHPPAHCKTRGRKFLSQPVRSKYGHREGRGSGVRSSLGSLWRDKRVERDQVEVKGDQEMTEYSHSTTLKGTRVTSSNGENYIILSPVNPGEQLLQPVYHNGTETIGRLYQTHPRRAQKFLPDLRAGSSPQPFSSCTSTLSPPPTSSSAPPSNYSNYQNCTVVQSHLPCSSYGTYVTLAPKTLIFPVFVQPLDLCSPGRTLLMSEEMILHQADLLSAKVTVLIYSDLLLLTREDEAGQCNVLQSPLYLNTLQIREVLSEPLHIYILQDSQTDCCFLFSLESFSIEQKVKVSLCLQDNVQLQLVAAEAARRPQSDILHPSPTFPCSAPPPPLFLSSLSPYTSSSSPSRIITTPSHLQPPLSLLSSPNQRSPIWKERGRTDDEDERRKRSQAEERQQAEGESASETSENLGGRGFLLSSHHFNMEEENSDDEEEERCTEEVTSSFRPAGLRRSFSEGSLLQEPRSPRFLSDSTIHRLTRPVAFDLDSRSRPHPRPPSPHTLRKQLTGEGGSLQQILLLLNGTKDPRSRNLQLKLKSRSLAADVRSRMWFLRRRKNSSCFHSNSLEKALRNHRPSAAEVLSWAESLEALLSNQYGMAVFRHFLRSEFSEENLDFWLAVERLKQTRPPSKMASRAEKIYAEFISTSAVRQVNVDSSVREATSQSLRLGGHPASFQLAQDQVFGLMETDSYPRFLKSHLYVQLTNQSAARSVPVSQL